MALTLWSKLESAGDVTNPQIGTGGAEVGSPTYQAAQFGNGIFSDIDNEGCTFPTGANSINLDKGTIEFWVKMKHASGDTDYRQFFDFMDTHGIYFFTTRQVDGKSKFYTRLQYEGGSIYEWTNEQIWAVDDKIHFAVTWDRQGNDIGDSKTLVIYRDNVEIDSDTTKWDPSPNINSNIYFGLKADGTYHSDMVIDNPKIYDVCKTDFSDRFDEDAGAAGVKTLIQAALISAVPLIALPTLHEIAKFTGPRV